jgi:hypothetical protein
MFYEVGSESSNTEFIVVNWWSNLEKKHNTTLKVLSLAILSAEISWPWRGESLARDQASVEGVASLSPWFCQVATMLTFWLTIKVLYQWKNSTQWTSTPFSRQIYEACGTSSTSYISQWHFFIKPSLVSDLHTYYCHNKSIIRTFCTNFI